MTKSCIFTDDPGKAEKYSKKGNNLYPTNLQFMLLDIYSTDKNKKKLSSNTISAFGKEIKKSERIDWMRNYPYPEALEMITIYLVKENKKEFINSFIYKIIPFLNQETINYLKANNIK